MIFAYVALLILWGLDFEPYFRSTADAVRTSFLLYGRSLIYSISTPPLRFSTRMRTATLAKKRCERLFREFTVNENPSSQVSR